MRQVLTTIAVAAALVAAVAASAAADPVTPLTVVVDAREAGRNIVHVEETIRVTQSGEMTLYYPKWVPGEHGPTGPIANVAAIRMTSGGTPVQWQRDLVDFYAFHVDVPQGATSLDVKFDQLIVSSDQLATPNMLIVNWNRELLYPAGLKADEVLVDPSIILPSGWDFGTALSGPHRTGDRIDFNTVSLTTLVDSPLDSGTYARHITLLDAGGYTNQIDAFGDAPGDLALSDDNVQKYKDLVAEADALYGARHWYHYHFLLTLSDAIGFQGIEHHESSDNRAPADYWTDPQMLEGAADLLPHEFSHSWNGKYRRPADLITTDYQMPERTDLLWVYEGMNQYLGDMLAYRSGFVDPKLYPEYLAYIYAQMDNEPGRLADPLIDLTTSAPYLYQAPGDWSSQRRSADDFYTEGELIWLSADAIIRTQSHGTRSLDDFLHAFDGQRNTGPMVIGYTREDVENALNSVQPYDWHGFFQQWVYDVAPHPAPMGIELTGWKMIWNDTPNHWDDLNAGTRHQADFTYSLGFSTDDDGKIDDVNEGSPAALAGIGTSTQIIAVNGQKYTPDVLHDAVTDAKSSTGPISLIVVSDDLYRTVSIDYHGGNRYPHLERVPGSTDLLAQIMAPHRAH
jgi:predicted metalloprotease with PDZ domain